MRPFLPLVVVLLASCSVLEIDVDVYKGPLANEPETRVDLLVGDVLASEVFLRSFEDHLVSVDKKLPVAVHTRSIARIRELLALFDEKPEPSDPSISSLRWGDEGTPYWGVVLTSLANDASVRRNPAAQRALNDALACSKENLADALMGVRITAYSDGRIKEGLRQLCADYQRQRAAGESGDQARRRMLDAFVVYAERVRLPANLHEFIPNSHSGAQSGGAGSAAEFVPLLQAIGNSIATASDDLIKHSSDADYRHGLGKAVSNSSEDLTHVIDKRIAELQFEIVKLQSDGMQPTEPSLVGKRTALDQLRTWRQDWVRLLPASSYLRSGNLASVLQNSKHVNWHNMLGDHALHQLPIYSELAGSSKGSRLRESIDNQFWQTVNRVRVAGSGTTNYVIAKDDIGNWYIKTFSADPEVIFKAARNLATYYFSGGVTVPVLPSGSTGDGGLPTNVTDPAAPANASLASRQIVAVSASMDKEREALIAGIRSTGDNMVASFVESLSARLRASGQRFSVRSGNGDPFEASDAQIAALASSVGESLFGTSPPPYEDKSDRSKLENAFEKSLGHFRALKLLMTEDLVRDRSSSLGSGITLAQPVETGRAVAALGRDELAKTFGSAVRKKLQTLRVSIEQHEKTMSVLGSSISPSPATSSP